MLKQISICAMMVVVIGACPAKAQQYEAQLQPIELSGAGFDLVLATRKSPATGIDLAESPDGLFVSLIGGQLALAFDDAGKMIETIESLRWSGCAFETRGRNGVSTEPVALYVVASRQAAAAGVRTASLDAPSGQPGMRKVEVPGQDFAIVFATTRTPIDWTSREGIDAIAVFSGYSELVMAVGGDVERMFKDVGLSRLPVCNFEVERKRSNPPEAATVYIVPKG